MAILNDAQFDKLKEWMENHKGASFKVTRRIDTYAAGTDEREAYQFITDSKIGETVEGNLYANPVFERKGQTNNDLYSLFEQSVQGIRDHIEDVKRREKEKEPGGNSGIAKVVFWAVYKKKPFVLLYVPVVDYPFLGDGSVQEIYEEADPGKYAND